MAFSMMLALFLTTGPLVLCAAALLHMVNQHRHRQQVILKRLSGEVALAQQPTATQTPEALRRIQQAPGVLRLMPTALAEASAAFSIGMPRRWMLIAMGAAVIVAVVLNIVANVHPGIGVVAGLVLATSLVLWLGHLRLARRRAAIDDALPEAMDMIVRALRVGLPIGAAIRASGRDLSGPLAEEFTITSDRISYGQDPSNALRDMAERGRNQSLRFFAAAVSLQSASGGNLAEVLERLGAIARQRQQTRRKIRSITAEAKWSGRFLSAFPLVATLALLGINPGYFSEISEQSFFLPMLVTVGVLLVLNILFMRWLVKLE